jgi:hypothetical protein
MKIPRVYFMHALHFFEATQDLKKARCLFATGISCLFDPFPHCGWMRSMLMHLAARTAIHVHEKKTIWLYVVVVVVVELLPLNFVVVIFAL